MATLLLNNLSELKYTNKSVIMQRTNYIDDFKILVPRYYGLTKPLDLLAKDTTENYKYHVYLNYILPISKTHKTIMLDIPVEETEDNQYRFNYKGVESTDTENILLEYRLPDSEKLTYEFTCEFGKLEVWLNIVGLEYYINDDNELSSNEIVRRSQHCIIPITKISDFTEIVDSGSLDMVESKIIELERLMRTYNEFMNNQFKNMPLDIEHLKDDDRDVIKLVAQSGELGDGVQVSDLAESVGENITGIDADGVQDGITNLDLVIDNSPVVNLDNILEGV